MKDPPPTPATRTLKDSGGSRPRPRQISAAAGGGRGGATAPGSSQSTRGLGSALPSVPLAPQILVPEEGPLEPGDRPPSPWPGAHVGVHQPRFSAAAQGTRTPETARDHALCPWLGVCAGAGAPAPGDHSPQSPPACLPGSRCAPSPPPAGV